MCAILVEMEETQFERAAPTKRIYQAWKGNNRFFFGGRLIFGPDVRAMFLTLSLILIPAVLFCAFIPQSAIYDCQQHPSSLVLAASTIFTVYILLLLLLTSGRDPGIIPRNACPPEPDEDVDTSCLTLDWIANMGTASTILPTKDVVVNGMVIKVKYCHTCMLYRPPRCSHCSICNNCVERFDHHCPWVGQCIGKRNYRIFFIFVASTTMFCLYVFGFCWLNISNITKAYHCNVWRALNKSPMSGILMVYAFVGAWFVGGLTAFHVYLICTNQTTYENFRYRYDRKTNPHNLGLIHNVSEIFFSKIPDSKANFRGKLKDHSSSAVNSSLSGGHCMRPERPKTGFDMDTSGDREDVAEEEFAALRNQMERVTSLERCGPQPRHANWYHGGNWEITTDIISSALAAEFGREHGLTARHKIG